MAQSTTSSNKLGGIALLATPTKQPLALGVRHPPHLLLLYRERALLEELGEWGMFLS